MKKILISAVAAISILSGSAYAASTANITITGTVPQILNIFVTNRASTFDLSTAVTAGAVASIKVISNRRAGYTVTVTSGNQGSSNCPTTNGACFYSPTTTEKLALTVKRDAATVSFTGASGQFATKTTKSAPGGDVYSATVAFDGSQTVLSKGTDYTETLTFSATVN